MKIFSRKTRLQEEIQQWQLYARRVRDAARIEVDGLRKENKWLWEKLELMTDKVVEAGNKPPVILEPPDVGNVVEKIGKAVGEIVYGRQEPPPQPEPEPPTPTFFPATEFDEWLGEDIPQPSEISNQQFTDEEYEDAFSHNPDIFPKKRADGQPLFGTQSTSPPQGGVE